MASKKTSSSMLKAKMEKLEKELGKIKKQKSHLNSREKEVQGNLKEAQASYIVALMSESGRTLEELEDFAQTKEMTLPDHGEGQYVQNYE